jgi:hypothetical protein
VHRAASPVRLSVLLHLGAEHLLALCCRARPARHRLDVAGIAKEVRWDVGPEFRQDDPGTRHSDEIVVVLRLGACPAARRGGLVLDQKGLPDVRDIVARALGHRSGVAHQALLLLDALPRELRVPCLALQAVAVLRAWVQQSVMAKQVLRSKPVQALAARQAPFRVLPQLEWRSLDVLRDEPPATVSVQQGARFLAQPQEQLARLRALPPSRARQSRDQLV